MKRNKRKGENNEERCGMRESRNESGEERKRSVAVSPASSKGQRFALSN